MKPITATSVLAAVALLAAVGCARKVNEPTSETVTTSAEVSPEPGANAGVTPIESPAPAALTQDTAPRSTGVSGSNDPFPFGAMSVDPSLDGRPGLMLGDPGHTTGLGPFLGGSTTPRAVTDETANAGAAPAEPPAAKKPAKKANGARKAKPSPEGAVPKDPSTTAPALQDRR